MKELRRKISGFILLALFTGAFASSTLFYHLHYLEKGIIIVHSHPFSNSNGAHGHSTNQLLTIHSLNNFLLSALISACLFDILKSIIFRILKESNETLYIRICRIPASLRAPPLI